MASFYLVPIFFSLNFVLFLCNAENADHKFKSALIKGILHKVFNLTLTFGNLPIEQRKNMIMIIEKKLKKSAQYLGSKSNKYVDLVMKGVKSLVFKHNNDVLAQSGDDDVEQKSIQEKKTSTRNKTDGEHIENNGNKIKLIVDKTLNNLKAENSVGKIEQNIESVVKKLLMSNKQNKKLLKTDKVLQQKIIKMIKESVKRNDAMKDNAKRMEFKFNNNIIVTKVPKAVVNKHSETRKSYNVNSSTVKNYYNLPIIKNNLEYNNVTLKSECHDFNIKTICVKIKALKAFKCNDKEMPIVHLCDGINQCSDHSDERDCAIQGVYKVRNASKIMSDIEYGLSQKCYKANVAKSMISNQNELLGIVLQRQLEYIEKHNNDTLQLSSHAMRKFNVQPKQIRNTMQQVVFVITTLSSALLKAVCPAENDARRFNTDDEDFIENFEEQSLQTSTWSPQSCTCFEEYCVGNCLEDCKRICLQRFKISKWQCKAVSGKNTISLDLICDGKLDCYDKTDEDGCNKVSDLAKFESDDIYNSVLDMISTKTKSALFEKVRYKLINLENIVKKLQKSATQRIPDVLEVKALRDECFFAMTEIYDLTKYYGPRIAVVYDTYVFLISVNQKLVSAMKRSQTGNELIVAPDGCFCRDDQCALLKCSEACKRACAANLKLTRYFCRGSLASNNSISIDAICNSKNDCSEKDDEQGCSNDICRKHHFVLLRHNLDKAYKGGSDTPVENAINFWKTKVSLTLRVLESKERPTLQILRNVIHDMLHHLLMTYAGLTAKSRSNEEVITEFYKMSLVVMNALKSCSK